METLSVLFLLAYYGGFFWIGTVLAKKYNKSVIGWGLLGAFFPLSLIYFAFLGKTPTNNNREQGASGISYNNYASELSNENSFAEDYKAELKDRFSFIFKVIIPIGLVVIVIRGLMGDTF